MKYLSLCMIALLTFTSVSFASVSAVNGEESTETTSHGGVCMDERSAAHDSIQPLRDEMKQNWETFREAYGSIQQYFEGISDEDKIAIRTLRIDTKNAIHTEKKDARQDFKRSFDTGVIDEVAGIIIDLRTITFDELRDYVTIDTEGYDAWVAGYMAVMEANESLRKEIADIQATMRKNCYNERTQNHYERATTLIDKATQLWDSEKMLERFPMFIEKIDAMIEKTNASEVPDEQKESRVQLMYALQDAIQALLDDLQS